MNFPFGELSFLEGELGVFIGSHNVGGQFGFMIGADYSVKFAYFPEIKCGNYFALKLKKRLTSKCISDF